MDPKRFPVTREGYERLVKELERLKETERPRIIAAVAEARSHGDLRENAAYDAARHDQAMLEKKITELEQMLKNHVIIESDAAADGVVRLGSTVVVEIEGDEERYTIVGALEAKPAEGLISNESPVGKALLGRRVGEDAVVASPRGSSSYRVLAIEN
ncbi:MAG: transcription elongation factor GreA [Chloroflexota bacterium]